MSYFLKQLKLKDCFTFRAEMSHEVFLDRLKQNVDHGDVNFTSEAFEHFESRENNLKGIITDSTFQIKKRRGWFDIHLSKAIANGTFQQNDKGIKIEGCINSFRKRMYFYYGFLILMYLFLLYIFYFSNAKTNFAPTAYRSGIISLAILTLIPYLLMVKSTRRLKKLLLELFQKISKE